MRAVKNGILERMSKDLHLHGAAFNLICSSGLNSFLAPAADLHRETNELCSARAGLQLCWGIYASTERALSFTLG